MRADWKWYRRARTGSSSYTKELIGKALETTIVTYFYYLIHHRVLVEFPLIALCATSQVAAGFAVAGIVA